MIFARESIKSTIKDRIERREARTETYFVSK